MNPAFLHLEHTLKKYHLLPDASLQRYFSACNYRTLNKGELLYPLNNIPSSFAFLHKGLMRAYLIDADGNEFNKNFFAEGRFPGSMSALLNNQPSFLAIEAMEACEVIEINFTKFRAALFSDPEIMTLHIHYLEKHWLLEKEPKEMGYLQHEARERYLAFLTSYQDILPRVPQFHIASYLGITPTQLSRIKKELKN